MRGFLGGLAAGLVIAGLLGLNWGAGGAAAQGASERRAYLVVLGTVHEREIFLREYASKLTPLYQKYGGRYLAIGRDLEVLEGDTSYESYVIAEWPSMEAARAFWNSPEYDVLRRARLDGEWATFDVLLIEGLPQ